MTAFESGPEPYAPPQFSDNLSYRRHLREQSEQLRRKNAMQVAYRFDPDVAAHAAKLSEATGAPVEQVIADPKNYESLLQQYDVGNEFFAQRYPTLARRLEDANFVAMTRDDLGNLKKSEDTWDWFFRSLAVGDAGSLADITRASFYTGEDLSYDERLQLERYYEIALAHEQRDLNVFEYVAASVLELGASSWRPLAAGAAASLVTTPVGGVITAGMVAADMEASILYADLVLAGTDPATARAMAAAGGVAMGGLEAFGLKLATAPFKTLFRDAARRMASRALTSATMKEALRRAGREYGKALLVEPLTEVGQESIGMGIEDLARAMRGETESLFDPTALADVWFKTTVAMTVMGAFGATGTFAVNARRAADAQHNVRVSERMRRRSEESKTAKRAESVHEDFVQDAAEDHAKVSTAYVKADKAEEVLAQLDESEMKESGERVTREQLEQRMPGFSERLQTAAASGGFVQIPVGQFDSLLRTPLGSALLQHTTYDPDTATPFEAEEILAQMDEGDLIARQEEILAQNAQTESDWRAQATSIREQVKAQAVAAGRPADEARQIAHLAAASAVVRAEILGITPEEFWNQQGFTIETATDTARPDSAFAQEVSPGFYAAVLQQKISQLNPDSALTAEVVEAAQSIIAVVANLGTEPRTVGDLQEIVRSTADADNVPELDRALRATVDAVSSETAVDINAEAEAIEPADGSDFDETKFRAPVVTWAKDRFGDAVAPNGRPVWQNFVIWFGDSKLVDSDGNPVEVYHGTTHTFLIYDEDAGGLDNYHGRGFYATTTRNDAESNYTTVDGPDLRNRIDLLADRLINDDPDLEYDDAFEEAKRQLVGDAEGRVIEAVMSMRRPAVVGKNSLGLDETVLEIEFVEDEEGNVIDESGSGVDFILALRGVVESYSSQADDVVNAAYGAIVDYGTLRAVEEEVRRNGEIYDEDTGDLVNMGQVLRETYERLGYDGIVFGTPYSQFRGMPGTTQSTAHIVAFRAEQIKDTENNLGDYDVDDSSIVAQASKKGARGYYEARLRKILLTDKANSSTLIHEMGHWHVQTMMEDAVRLIENGNSNSQLVRDAMTVLQWAGFDGTIQEWLALPIAERAQVHEAFANSAERYFFDPKNAPSQKMRGVFHKFAAFLGNAYLNIIGQTNARYRKEFGRDLPGLTPEVKQVFGRLIAADRDITTMRDIEAVGGLFETIEDYRQFADTTGKSEEEIQADWDAYQQALVDDRLESISEMQRARLREMGRLSNARSRAIRELQRRYKQERERIRSQVYAEGRRSAAGRLRHFLRTGEVLDKDGNPIDFKADSRRLNTEAVRTALPPGVDTPKHLVAKDGVDPELLATLLGYRSGRDLVRELVQRVPTRSAFEAILDAEVDRRMLVENSDLMDPVVRERQVREAMATDRRRSIVANEIAILTGTGQTGRVLRFAAERSAEEIVSRTPLHQLQVRSFAAAARRARVAAAKALRDGDRDALVAAKEAELLNEALIAETIKIRKEVEQLRQLAGRANRSDRQVVRTGRDTNYVNALRAVLHLWGMSRRSLQGQQVDFFAEARANAPEIVEMLESRIEEARIRAGAVTRRHGRTKGAVYTSATGAELRELHVLAKELWNTAQRVRQVELDGRKQDVEDAREEARTTLGRLKDRHTGQSGTPTRWERFRGWVGNPLTNLVRVEAWTRWVDKGDSDGIFSRLFRRIKSAGDRFRQTLVDYSSNAQEIIDQFDLKGHGRIEADLGEGHTFGEGIRSSKAEVIMLAMHYYSNPSNREKLVRGMGQAKGWTEQQIGVFLRRMVDEGVLTRKDFDLMQQLLDLNASSGLLGAAQKAHYAMFGYFFKTVEMQEIGIPEIGMFRGGYLPVRYNADTVGNLSRGKSLTDEDLGLEIHKALPTTPPSGFAQARTQFWGEIDLNLQGLVDHYANVARFAYMSEAVRDVRRVLLDDVDTKRVLQQKFGAKFVDDVVRPWLERSATQTNSVPDNNPFVRSLMWLARSANTSIMFLNLGNALQNFTGFQIALRSVGPQYMLSSIVRYVRGGLTAEVTDAEGMGSEHMKQRLGRQIFEVRGAIAKQIRRPGVGDTLASIRDWPLDHAYVAQIITQNFVDVVVYDAAFQQNYKAAVARGETHEEAIRIAKNEADSVVRRTQMAGNPEDLSAFESGHPLLRAMFPFKTWFVNWANNYYSETQLAETRIADHMTNYVMLLMLPAVSAYAISRAAGGRLLEDEDDDGLTDDMITMFWKSQVSQVLGAVPLYGDVANLALNQFTDDAVWNNRMPAMPAVSLLNEAVAGAAALTTGEWPGFSERDDIYKLFTVLTGVPVASLGSRVDLTLQTPALFEDTGGYDTLRSLATGRPSPEQRLSLNR